MCGQVSLGEQDVRPGATLPGDREHPLQAVQVGSLGQRDDQEEHVDVGSQHLPASVAPAGASLDAGSPGQDGAHRPRLVEQDPIAGGRRGVDAGAHRSVLGTVSGVDEAAATIGPEDPGRPNLGACAHLQV